METYIPLSRIPGPIIVANLQGKALAPIRHFEEPESTLLGSPSKPVAMGEVTTLRALVGAKKTLTMREAFAA